MFKEQKKFLANFINLESLTEDEKVKFSKEYILSIHRELGEVLDTIPWKLHRKNEVVKSKANIAEEIIDCFKFLLNLCLIWKIDDDKFVKEFYRKSTVVWQRYNQEILNVINKKDKVCAIDLDNTLSNSDEYFTKIFNKEYNTNLLDKQSIKDSIGDLRYEEFKYSYRESGEKVNIPVKRGAKELCDYLKRKGFKIVIISARPYEKHSRIFPDTLEWLANNEIQYDAVYFEKDKHIKILKELSHLSFIVEDDIDYAKQISGLGYKVYLLNREKIKDKNIIQINNLIEIKKYEEKM